jgi:hypothetical protein
MTLSTSIASVPYRSVVRRPLVTQKARIKCPEHEALVCTARPNNCAPRRTGLYSARATFLKLLKVLEEILLLANERFDDRVLDRQRPSRRHLRGDELDAPVDYTLGAFSARQVSCPAPTFIDAEEYIDQMVFVAISCRRQGSFRYFRYQQSLAVGQRTRSVSGAGTDLPHSWRADELA